MGSLIKGVLFMPPKKDHPDENKIENREYIKTAHGNQIKLIKLIQNPEYLYMLVSHGNAEDVYIVYQWVKNILSKFVNVNIIMYEYTGYDKQDTLPFSEQFIYDDADAAFKYMINKLNIPPQRIIIFGRSLGSGPSCYLAEKYDVAGLFLNSGFMSVYRVAFKFRLTLPGDMFPNIDRIKNIKCPVCIVHSVKDEIIPFYHAREMYKNSVNKFPPLFIDGTSHNSIDRITDAVYIHMQKFFKHIDPNYVMKETKDFYENVE